jgi:hypothetical protein
VYVYTTDEKMGIQGTEHAHPKEAMKVGVPERIDPEYKRYGTTGIITSRDVATGEIGEPMIQRTRTEKDFVTPIESVVSPGPAHTLMNGRFK